MDHECWGSMVENATAPCIFGDVTASTTVVLMGDSHAEHWLPAMDRIGRERHWKVYAMVKPACPVADVEDMLSSRLKRRYTVAVSVRQPAIAYRETIRKAAAQHGRHKKQSGGHGQFGDVVIEIRPLARGEGFLFEDRITGGAIPRQWIPAVEQGIRDAMLKGPLGAPVVDVAVALVDGSFHAVDSSELAFRTAGRIAMADALAAAAPYLLEPIAHVAVHTPGSATSRITSAVATRRGQMLGMTPQDGWSRWDRIEVMLPEAELHGLEAELRSLSQGMARYEARFDHLAEVTAKLADGIVHRAHEPA